MPETCNTRPLPGEDPGALLPDEAQRQAAVVDGRIGGVVSAEDVVVGLGVEVVREELGRNSIKFRKVFRK